MSEFIKNSDVINALGYVPADSNNLVGYTATQTFTNFTGNTIYVTDESLPDLSYNIFIYKNGILIESSTYTINENIITLTTPVATPSTISLFWFLDKNNYTNRLPSTITDLTVKNTGSASVLLGWTCGGAYSMQGVVDYYRIYYSQYDLSTNSYINANHVDVTKGLGGFGSTITAAIGNLKYGTAYYFMVVGVSGTKKGNPSNVAATKTIDALLSTVNPSNIVIQPEDVVDYHNNVNSTVNLDGTTDFYIAKNTVNGTIVEGTNIPLSGSTLGSYFQMTWTGFNKSWSNYTPYQIVYDLREIKKISTINLYVSQANNVINVYTSQIGNQFVFVGSINFSSSTKRNQWITYQTINSNSLGRYVMLEFSSVVTINEVSIFGNSLVSKLPTGTKLTNDLPTKTLGEMYGSNVFLDSCPATGYTGIGASNRIYTNWSQWMPRAQIYSTNMRLFGDTSNGVDNQIKYNFEHHRIMGNLDVKLAQNKQYYLNNFNISDCVNYFCIKKCLPFLWPRYTGSTESTNGSNYRIQDTEVYPQYSNTTNPFTYRLMAQFVFTIAARYGRTTGIDESLIALDDTNTMKQGMDLVKYIEVGNETNATWFGPLGYYSPEEYAAVLSACYDGHMGRLGPGFGIKQADPTMKLVTAGLTGQNVAYIKRMMMWSDANRGVNNYPFDIVSMHYYHNTVGGQLDKGSRRGLSPEGLNPVRLLGGGGQFYEVMKYMVNWRNTELPGVELWLGESGYDEHPSKQSPVAQTNRSMSLLKADFNIRMLLHVAAAGVDAFQQYMYRNGTTLKNIIKTTGSIYLSCGLVDYLSTGYTSDGTIINYSDSNPSKYPPLPTYYYLRNFMSHMKYMKFSHNIRLLETTNVDDILLNIDETDNTLKYVCAMAFKNHSPEGGSDAIVVWVGKEAYESTTIQLAVDPNEFTVTHVKFDDSEINTSSYGTVETLTTNQTDVFRYCEFPINGTPSIIFTNNIGTKAIETPELFSRSTSTSSVRLYWNDNNVENYAIEIFKYNDLNSQYESIFKDYTTELNYDISNLTPGMTYKFICKFIDLPSLTRRESTFSNEVIITMPTVLPDITGLTQTSVSYDRVTFSWDYPLTAQTRTDGFMLFKATDPTGVYNQIASLSNNVRSFTDYNLVEDTTYYYKIQAFSSLSSSNLSGFIGFTTLSSNFNRPIPIGASTNYFGDRISVWFDVPLSTSLSILNNITILESGTTQNLLYVTSTSIDSTTNSLILNLSTKISESTSQILIGYDGLGLMKSKYSVNVASFSNYPVTNNLNSSGLINRKIKISFNGDDTAYGTGYTASNMPIDTSDWNEIKVNGLGATYLSDLVDSTSNFTSLIGTIARYTKTTASGNIGVSPQGPSLTSRSITVDEFPDWTLSSGLKLSSVLASSSLSIAFLVNNLDSTKTYEVKYFLTTNAAFPTYSGATVDIMTNYDTTTFTTHVVGGNISQVLKTPKLSTFTPTNVMSDLVTIPYFSTPSVMLGLRVSDALVAYRYPSVLCAAIINEINNESLI